ncbi:hypothetical protein GCM10007049_15990 [Echinicola pacifica]|uniref:Uncharacterized protein n=1 Tax=Echinicola pacifica TaxID=346377 RepID=A0A918PUM6_9BACT|nr:hypothetical protein [Echinicola pacifica]GGZ23780.1 hypothetical protein GCM10007049_15990 [Echinicola pacifica]
MKKSIPSSGLWALLCVIAVFYSCEEQEQLPAYPITLTFDSIAVKSEMRVFAGGELLDPLSENISIADYLGRYYTIGFTSYNSKFVEPGINYGDGARFTYFANGRISFASEISAVERVEDAIIMKSNLMNEVEDTPLVDTDFFKFPYDISSYGQYTIQHIMYGEEQSALEVALLYYKLVRYSEEGTLISVDFGTVHNVFNEDFIEHMTSQDTLAVKSYRLHYSAKP